MKTMPTITRLSGLEILDSRGRPTVRATCHLAGGARGAASVPSGASTGRAEAFEMRDGDPARYAGLGCRRAVENISTVLNDALTGEAATIIAGAMGYAFGKTGTDTKPGKKKQTEDKPTAP